jgi:uncharacterized RmlC-like cupin family protein
MSKSAAESVQLIKPGQTYVGKQGFSYGAGASTETVGAKKVCLNVLPVPPVQKQKSIITRVLKPSPIFWKASARSTTAINWNIG